ncbi:hypothetical protein O181_010319 [Austropuccinia psidii MF-1]|uniref:Uncharacterized protein n=1 Tax=Austropuccinia psidii MF-1 TaxID=1389203 RepID=A0A9Q3GKQ5_9BASI|nr:hypothetical protein [Austropuccinia psidii MF-1]
MPSWLKAQNMLPILGTIFSKLTGVEAVLLPEGVIEPISKLELESELDSLATTHSEKSAEAAAAAWHQPLSLCGPVPEGAISPST